MKILLSVHTFPLSDVDKLIKNINIKSSNSFDKNKIKLPKRTFWFNS